MTIVHDLHTHSYCSDGKLSPQALVELAQANGVTVLALTDHDCIDGIVEAQAAASAELRLIAGIEFSSQWKGRGIHIVGLQVDTDSAVLQAAVAQQTQTRTQRAETIAQRLEKAGIKGALEGAKQYAKGAAIGRPHFAQYMVDSGYVSNFAQAFKKYLGSGKMGDVKEGWPEVATVVEWIVASGGIAVLAHPDKYELTRTKLYSLLEDFVAAGGRALEVVSGKQDPSVTDKLARAAKDFSLLASCGSDFHSPGLAWQSLGKYSPMPATCEPVWNHFR
ncbi:MAG: putative metal-dependent phosphoesterase TrpH [Kiritimatiellia bacterium]|jgi:predicted metal-dependent phosphoesterase TrpH